MGAVAEVLKGAIKRGGDEASLGSKLRSGTLEEEAAAKRATQTDASRGAKGDDFDNSFAGLFGRGPLGVALKMAWAADEKRTDAFLRKLGFNEIDNPQWGRSGPSAFASFFGWTVTTPAARIAQAAADSPGNWEEQMALYEKQNRMTHWLKTGSAQPSRDPAVSERNAREAERWARYFVGAQDEFAKLGKEWATTKEKDYKLLRDSLLGVDSLIDGIQPRELAPAAPKPNLQRALGGWEKEKRQADPSFSGPRSELTTPIDATPAGEPPATA